MRTFIRLANVQEFDILLLKARQSIAYSGRLVWTIQRIEIATAELYMALRSSEANLC
jgi:hypothetical protein